MTRTFAPQLVDLKGAARERRLARLIVATDIFTWRLLRLGMELPARAKRIVAEMIDPPK